MRSILKQLAKYQQPAENVKPPIIEIKQNQHPYQQMVENLCSITDLASRKRTINDALLALNDFTPPPMSDQLYPLELAVLYHLFYRYRITLCPDSHADTILGQFLKSVADEGGGLNSYMQVLRNCLDKNSTMIFLYRVMLAAFGARGRYDSKRDHIKKEFGLKAARTLGVEASARVAGHGLDSLSGSEVEQLILGRITYIAFWEWSQIEPVTECTQYLILSNSGDIQGQAPNRRTPVALPPHQS